MPPINGLQIYLATYSNVPVFEFVTSEGPIMRRKLDGWINATHILKIAKFPKAKRTRILEKDVQTGIHEKVQGGYGKYQGTYVPLDIGKDIARTFGVLDVLQPIFDFVYVEGSSDTPPPAPKHSHASASNMAKRLAQVPLNGSERAGTPVLAKKSKSTNSIGPGEPPKKRGRPKRVTLADSIAKPLLHENRTAPIDSGSSVGIDSIGGPSIGTFNAGRLQNGQDLIVSQLMPHPSFIRQDTEQDALQVMASNMNVRNEDLELPEKSSDEEEDDHLHPNSMGYHRYSGLVKTDDEELISGRELFGTPRDSFEKIVQHHNRHYNFNNSHSQPTSNGSTDPYSLLQYHHHTGSTPVSSQKEDIVYSEYFNNLLNYFLEDGSSTNASRRTNGGASEIPEKILNPPQPLSKININQSIDNEGNTIFHWACSMGNITVIEFLLSIFSSFIKTDLKNNSGESPLMFLVKFSNSYQLKNFPTLLDLLFDSILSIDNDGRTVLHHIALSSTTNSQAPSRSPSHANGLEDQLLSYRKNKERYSRYYMECLFAKVIEIQEFQLLSADNKKQNAEDKKELIAKFINHQDSNGNAAFHIVAYNLNKKCINIFISYHKYIDFSLKNLVNYTVEDYLASHNYVLRLDTGGDDSMRTDDHDDPEATIVKGENEFLKPLGNAQNTRSFESHLYYSKMAINLQNTTSNLVTEKLTELAYAIDKELGERDEKLLSVFKYLKYVNQEKVKSQREILQFFKLDYLLEDNEDGATELLEKGPEEFSAVDSQRDKVIQDEVSRLVNDLSFQYLKKREELNETIKKFENANEKATNAHLMKLEKELSKEQPAAAGPEDSIKLASELQQQIVKRRKLAKELYQKLVDAPSFNIEENNDKENETTNPDSKLMPAISNYSPDDKLFKYCKLISVCCGMTFSEVENSIDLIEQSLLRSQSQSLQSR